MLPKEFIRTVSFLVTMGGLIAFAILHGLAISEAFRPRPFPVWLTSDAMLWSATTLTGLVGGVVAVAFGVKPDTDLQGGAETKGQTAQMTRALRRMTGLDSTGEQTSNRLKDTAAMVYVCMYLIVGGFSWVAYIFAPGGVTEQTKSLALVTVGIMVAVINKFVSK